MNVISFSLWGKDLKYYKGAIENCKLAKIYYPDWICRFYIDSSVDIPFQNVLKKYGCQIIFIDKVLGANHGMYWRYTINDDNTVDKYIIRDADSRINDKERAAVDDWIKSGKSFHNMRDCSGHYRFMQGAMWGGSTGKFNITELINKYGKFDNWGQDESFLSKHVWPLIKDDCCVHDPYYEKIPFPPHKPINGFIGQRYDLYNNPLP